MSSQITYRVLAGVDRNTFAGVADELGLRGHGKVKRDDECHEEVWTDAPKTSAVNYIEDPYSDLTYISLRGPDTNTLLAELDRKIELYDPDELVEIAYDEGQDYRELSENLLRLAITFPRHDPTVHHIFENYALTAPHAELRTTALDAIGLRAWEELRPVVKKVASDDEDGEVREHAKRVLERWAAARGE